MQANLERYLKTSIYTYAGSYRQLLQALPDDIPAIGRLVCGQITHPSMYFTEPSPYLEDTYFGKFSAYPKHRFKNEDELYITALAMLGGIFYLDEARFTENKDVTKRITVQSRRRRAYARRPHTPPCVPTGTRRFKRISAESE